MSEAVIAGAAESPYTRHPDPETTGTESLLADAFLRALQRAGVRRAQVAGLGVAQRAGATGNPLAVYREPLTLEDYLAAPVVAEPLGRYDCVPVVSGADALVVTSRWRAPAGIRVRALRALHNPDGQDGDGLR